jgi:tetratricopeptide (TPR) repeat protein
MENTLYQKIDKFLDIENTKEAKKYLRNIKKRDGIYFYYLGEIERINGLLEKSFKRYLKALSKLDKKSSFYQKTLLRLASITRSKGKIRETEKYLKILKKLNPKDLDFLLEMAMYFRMKGDFKNALYYFSKLKKIYTLKKDFQGLSYIYWAEGGIFRLEGNFKKGIISFKKSIEYALKAKDKSLLLYANFALAGILRIYGRINDSFKVYSKSLKFIDENDYFSKAYYHCGIANALRQMGNYKKAIENYLVSYRYYLKTGDKLDLALVLWGLGNAYMRVGKFKDAKDSFLKAERLFKDGFEPRGKILNLFSLSYLYYIEGRKEKAKNIYFKALKEAKKNNLNTYLEIFT